MRDITQENLHNVLHYDPETGIFRWKERQLPEFATSQYEFLIRVWNSRWAGQIVGSPDRNGHIYITHLGSKHAAHRLAWLYVHGEPVPMCVDHINGIYADNRISNLRAATRHENAQNSRLRKDNTSGHKGVSRCRKTQRWIAQITAHGYIRQLGRFDSIEDAIAARKEAEAVHFGEFSRKD